MVGARPNFVKMAPILEAFKAEGVHAELVQRPVTVMLGTNRVVDTNPDQVAEAAAAALSNTWHQPTSGYGTARPRP